MKTQENKHLIRDYFDVVARDKETALNKYVAGDHLREHILLFEEGLPGYHLHAEDMVAEGDQVEADDQQVNLTRFSLFFPEKRLFFQERASIFDFGMSEPASVLDFSSFSTSRLFYSRRIGLYEGQPVRILGGGRVVGRVGD